MKGKKVLALLLALLMMMTMLPLSALAAEEEPSKEPVNLLMNGSFNDPDLFDYYWWIDPNGGPYRGTTCTYQATGGVDNSGCVKMTGAGPDGMACLSYLNQVTAPVAVQVVEGRTYRFSADIFRPEGVTADIRLDAENLQNPYAITTSAGIGKWEHLSYDVTIPAGTNGDLWVRCIDLGQALLTNQYVLIDNYSLVCISDEQDPTWVTPSENLLRNGDFANESHCLADYHAEYGGIDAAWLPEGGVDNSSCLELTVNGAAENGCIMYRRDNNWDNRFKPLENYWYAISADVFREEGFDKTVCIDGENWQSPNAVATKNGEWEHLHYTFKAGVTNNGYYDLRVVLLGIQADAGKKVKIDNLRVICLSEAVDPGFEPLAPDGEPGKNLLVNGNFDLANTGAIWGRDDWNAISEGGRAFYTSMRGVNGTGAWLMIGGPGTDPTRAAGFVMGDKPMTLTAGATYILSAKIFRPAGVDSDVNVSVRNVNGDALMFRTPAPAKNGEWETVSVKFSAAGNDSVWIMARGEALPNGAQVIVDDVELRQLGGEPDDTQPWAPLGGNILNNGNFSAGDTNWWPRDDWGGGYFRPTDTNGVNNGPCFVVMGKGAVGHDGAAGLWYKSNTGKYLHQLKTGEIYCFRADVFRPEGTTGAVSLKIRREEGDQVICSSDLTVKTGEWETIYVYFQAPDEVVSLDINASSLPDGEKMYVDNVKLCMIGGEGSPDTNDFGILLPAALMLISCAGMAAAGISKKRLKAK